MTPWVCCTSGLRLKVRLTPRGGRDAVDGIEQRADGEVWLKARVSAVPENGKANEALLRFLARQLKLPGSALTIASGATARFKTVAIEGDAANLDARLRQTFGDFLI